MRVTLAALVSAALLAILLAAPACIIPSIIQNTPDAGATPAASDSGAAPAVKGASCTAITASISLCEYISSCPSLVLPAQFTQCGFRINGSALDPECLCDGHYLCPIGHPTTCSQAAAAASGDTTYDSVCQQSVSGGCTDLTAGSGSTTTSACQTCVNACDNVPTCIDSCGC